MTSRPEVTGQKIGEGEPKTLSVPEAGRIYYGLSPQGSYTAAARGDLPLIRLGRRLRVPVRAMEAMLDSAMPRERGGKGA